MVPPWESFPDVNRLLAGRLLGLLAWRMTVARSRGGGEDDESGLAPAVGAD